MDGDGRADAAVGLYDGRVVFLSLATSGEWVPSAPSIETHQVRAAPLLYDADSDADFDLLVGSETGRILLYKNTGRP